MKSNLAAGLVGSDQKPSSKPSGLRRCAARLAAVLLLGGLSASAALTDGLTHQWNFDDSYDWHDSSFNTATLPTKFFDMVGSLDATPVNLQASNLVSGHEFMAVNFSGIGTRLDVGQDLSPELGGTATLAFWMQTTASGGTDQTNSPGVAGVTAAGAGIQWGWLNAAGQLSFSADGSLLAQTTAAVNDGKWHFVVLTRDAVSGVGQLYLDGTLADTRTGPTGLRSQAFQCLGRIDNVGNNGSFAGRLDKLTVFNRVISGAEVTAFMANHAPKIWNTSTDGVNDRPFSTVSVFARAYDVEHDTMVVQGWTNPAHGTIVHNGDGSFTYTTTTPGYEGSDSFAVTVRDGKGGYHRAPMTVKIITEPPGGNRMPVSQFVYFSALQAAGADISHDGWRTPRAIDWDNDGLKDLLVGAGGYVWLYINTVALPPTFNAGVKVQAAGTDIYAGDGNSPIAIADMTGDGVPDLVVADSNSKLRIYRNTSALGAVPVYAAPVFVKKTNGTTDFVLPDRRFDIGDYNNDGKPDLVTGTGSGSVQLFLNVNTAANPRFETGTTLFSDSYNIYPRICDLDSNGKADLVTGINWGTISYWLDVNANGVASSSAITVTDATGAAVDMKAATDGAVVDFADMNNDGTIDMIVGGHASDKIYIAYGVSPTIASSIAQIEAIYDAHAADLGTALSANNNALLNTINAANSNIVSFIRNGTLGTREAVYTALTTHINKYPFLKYQQLDTVAYHLVPSIVLQNWVFLEYALPDTPNRRIEIADTMGLTGTMREIFLETGLALGDNAESLPATYTTIRDLQRRHPREVFPDAMLSTDQIYNDTRAGFIWTPNSAKNTFGQWALGNANEWQADETAAIETVLGTGRADGDYFTFVMGHEVTHSLDNYVNTRANQDLRRRWGLMLCHAGGADIIAGANGWIDWTATQNNFKAKGYYDPATQTWNDGGANDAWAAYWATGPGSIFKDLSFMRFDISFFLSTAQESLATQANHHWANAPGRLIAATDRFRRGKLSGIDPMKANINEAVTFIDFISAGMNRVNLVETKNPTGNDVVWTNHFADLERDDKGRIIHIGVDGETYDLTVDSDGIVQDVRCSIILVKSDMALAFSGQSQKINVLANDYYLDGRTLTISSFTQPLHGTVTDFGNGVLLYRSNAGYTGLDSFTYQVGNKTGTVAVTVLASDAGLVLDTWLGLAGSEVVNLTSDSRYPDGFDQRQVITTFETTQNRGDSYGARVRGYLTPTTTGNYTFWIASDESSELWLSTDDTPANKVKIAYVTGATGSRVYTTYASQKSTTIALNAGQRYYIEALHKENSGNDNLAVAWQGPGFSRRVIASTNLSVCGINYNPVALNDSASLSIGTNVSVSVLANDSDANGDPLSIMSITQPANGTAVINGTSVTYTPTLNFFGADSFTYTITDGQGGTATATVSVNVLRASQVITFGALATKTYGDPPFDLTATASSGLPVTYVSSNTAVATIAGSTVTIVGAGTTTITASQAGSVNYNPAPDVANTLVVNKAAQTITFGALSSKAVGDAPFALTATASSGLPVTYTSSVPTVASVAGSIVTIRNNGTTTITAAQAGNANYNAATSVSRTLVVIRIGGTPTIILTPESGSLSAAGGPMSTELITNLPWFAKSTVPWLTVTPTGGSLGASTLTMTGTPNPNAWIRSGSVTVWVVNPDNTVALIKSFIVQQAPAAVSLAVSSDPTPCLLMAQGGSISLTITSNAEWTVAVPSGITWVSLSGTISGRGNGSAAGTVVANLTGAARSTTLTISSGSVVQTLVVTQSGAAADLTVTAPSTTIAANAGSTANISVAANIAWTATSNQTWLTLAPAAGAGNGAMVATAQLNASAISRVATVKVVGGGLTRSLTFTQLPAVSVTISLSAWTPSASTGTRPLTLTTGANLSWSSTSDQSWLTVTPASGTASAAGSAAITLGVTANPTFSSRTGTVTITSAGVSRTVTVTQPGQTPQLAFTNPSLSITAVQSSTGSHRVIPTTNLPLSDIGLTLSNDSPAGWLTASLIDDAGVTKVAFAYSQNLTVNARLATVTLRRLSDPTLTATLTVTQQALTPSAVSTQLVALSQPGTGIAASVVSQLPWTLTPGASWIQVAPAAGTGNGSFTVSAAANTLVSKRQGTLTFKDTAGKTIVIQVTQDPLAQVSISTDFSAKTVLPISDVVPLKITSTVAWTITSSKPWLTVSAGSGGAGTSTVNLTVTQNTSGSTRTAEVVVSGSGVVQRVLITQPAPPASITATLISAVKVGPASDGTYAITLRGTTSGIGAAKRGICYSTTNVSPMPGSPDCVSIDIPGVSGAISSRIPNAPRGTTCQVRVYVIDTMNGVVASNVIQVVIP